MKAQCHFVIRFWFAPDTHEGATTRRLPGWLRNLMVLAAFAMLPWPARAGLGLTNFLVADTAQSAEAFPLVAADKLTTNDLTGRWESFVVTTVSEPLAGVNQALVIAGSDKRGTIYGIYELSGQLGVSPWYWWADVPAKRCDEAGAMIAGP